jgi:hypothetical protein
MSVLKTQTALIKHLKTMLPAIPTAYESVSFTAPSGLYQRVQFRVSPPDDPVFGTGYYRERVELQIFVYGESNRGTGEVLAHAELIRQHFKKSTTLVEQGLYVHVLETPRIAGTQVIGSRVVCPVLIPTITEVAN